MSNVQVQLGGNTISVQVQSSGVARAAAAVTASAASQAAAAVSAAAALASQTAAAASAAAAVVTLSTAALKANNLSDLASAPTARTNLGLGSISTQAASAVAITGGSITGITDITVADGGTGASSASVARTNLGLAIGTDVQAYDADLTTWAGVTPGTNVAAFLATPSSANLAAALTDETGTGANVFATSPTLVTPALGTPSALVLTNATGLPAANANFVPAGTGAVTATVQAKLREQVSAFDFMTAAQIADVQARTRTLDVITPLRAAVAACLASGKALFFPAGDYRISGTLDLCDSGAAQSIVAQGEGVREAVFVLYTAVSTTPAIRVSVVSNSSFIGGRIGNFDIVCNGGAASGYGLVLETTNTNSAISVSEFHNIRVLNCTRGVTLAGTIYMSTLRNITVSGAVSEFGFYGVTTTELIYLSFTDLEVTACGSAAYSYYLQVSASQMRNLTADGVMYFSNPYGCVKGVTIEGLNGAAVPTTSAITLNQCDALEDVALINCPTAKTSIGINVTGRCNISGVRWPDSGVGNQPAQPLFLQSGSKGTVLGYQTARAVTSKIEAGSALADVSNWFFANCEDVTIYSFKQSAVTSWTPTYPSGWTTSPTLIGANYVRTGSMVTVAAYFTEGVSTAGAQIGGLPFACNSGTGFAISGSCNDSTERISGGVITGGTTINNIPALTLTGNFWQISLTYFV